MGADLKSRWEAFWKWADRIGIADTLVQVLRLKTVFVLLGSGAMAIWSYLAGMPGPVIGTLALVAFVGISWGWNAWTWRPDTVRFKGPRSLPEASLPQLREANADELSQPRIVGRTVYLSCVPRTPENGITIREKTFEDCLIVGPCIVTPIGKGIVCGECTFNVMYDADEIFYRVDEKRFLIGVIGLDDCFFRKCVFQRIGFMGPKDMIQRMKKELPGRSK